MPKISDREILPQMQAFVKHIHNNFAITNCVSLRYKELRIVTQHVYERWFRIRENHRSLQMYILIMYTATA
ncbi:MAG: hypothetical protein FWC13_03735 [Oscillospiraceae bacterium]|nr:hypothetical protein [Oscillospiraceae bacterium]